MNDPLELLRADRSRAQALRDPCAGLCTVASVDRSGEPRARTLVLRDVAGRLALFGNQTSPKWQQFEAGPTLAVVVWLPLLNLQYRLQCNVIPVPAAIVHESWQMRPEIPKRLDWFYTRHQGQGTPVPDRATLIRGLADVDLPEPLVAPDTAGGMFIEPFRVDRLDLAQPDGIHDRRHFELTDGSWSESILVP